MLRRPLTGGEDVMCILCDRGKPQLPSTSRRSFLKATAVTGLAAGATGLFGSSAEAQGHNVNPPPHAGRPGRRYVIRNGYVLTMEAGTPGADSSFGEFVEGDVLVEGKTIKAIGKNLHAGNATGIDARGKVVMPGWTDRDDGLRSPLPAGGRLYQRAVRRAFTARRRRHDGARHLADPPLAPALRCGHPGSSRYWPPRHAGLLRERRQCCGEPVSAGCDAPGGHFVVRRSRRLHHGRRGLSR